MSSGPHVRLTVGRLHTPDDWLDFASEYDDLVIPQLRGAPGFRSAFLGRDADDPARWSSIAFWDSRASADDYAAGAARRSALNSLAGMIDRTEHRWLFDLRAWSSLDP